MFSTPIIKKRYATSPTYFEMVINSGNCPEGWWLYITLISYRFFIHSNRCSYEVTCWKHMVCQPVFLCIKVQHTVNSLIVVLEVQRVYL